MYYLWRVLINWNILLLLIWACHLLQRWTNVWRKTVEAVSRVVSTNRAVTSVSVAVDFYSMTTERHVAVCQVLSMLKYTISSSLITNICFHVHSYDHHHTPWNLAVSIYFNENHLVWLRKVESICFVTNVHWIVLNKNTVARTYCDILIKGNGHATPVKA